MGLGARVVVLGGASGGGVGASGRSSHRSGGGVATPFSLLQPMGRE